MLTLSCIQTLADNPDWSHWIQVVSQESGLSVWWLRDSGGRYWHCKSAKQTCWVSNDMEAGVSGATARRVVPSDIALRNATLIAAGTLFRPAWQSLQYTEYSIRQYSMRNSLQNSMKLYLLQYFNDILQTWYQIWFLSWKQNDEIWPNSPWKSINLAQWGY